MKSRSEVLRAKKEKTEAAEIKAPAAERTIPLPALPPDAMSKCGECGTDARADACTVRADGFAECPSCGGVMKLQAPKTDEAPTRVDGKPVPAEAPPAVKSGPKNPEKKYCGTCGSEWGVVDGKFFTNCGHATAERIADPRKATKYGPPPPLGVRVEHEKARRDAEDNARKPASKMQAQSQSGDDASVSGPPPFGPGVPTLSGNRLSIPWGEARMPIDQWNNFKCGGMIITVEVPPGADRIEVADKIIDDLEAIAERLFRRQKAWYEKKLGILAGDSK